jgi:rod shape-determining protein MreD
MRTNRVILLTLLLIVFESSVVPWLVPSPWIDRLLPHMSFIMTLLIAGFAGRHRAFLFGLGFGLFQDMLFYGHLIGPYGFGMGLIGYLAGLLSEQRTYTTLGFFIWVVLIGSVMLDTIVFFIYKLFRLTNLQYAYVFYWQVVPTALLELLIALFLYVPFRRFLVKPSLSSGETGME